MSLREEILEASDLKSEVVDMSAFKGWPDELGVRELTAAQRDDYEAELVSLSANNEVEVNRSNARAKLVVRTVEDPETGDLVFDPEDADAVGNLPAAPISKLFNVAQRLNDISEADVEELVGN